MSHFEKIATDHNMNIGGKQALHVTGSQSFGIDGDVIKEIGGNSSHKVTKKYYLSVTDDLVIESAASITIKVGGNSIAIGPDGIALKGTLVKIEADTTMDVKGATTTVTASGTGKFDGGGMTTIKGGVVMIN